MAEIKHFDDVFDGQLAEEVFFRVDAQVLDLVLVGEDEEVVHVVANVLHAAEVNEAEDFDKVRLVVFQFDDALRRFSHRVREHPVEKVTPG